MAMRFFHPRIVKRGEAPKSGAHVFDGTYATPDVVAKSGAPVEIGYRLWRAPARAPAGRGRGARGVLLYFHGNGEVAPEKLMRIQARAGYG